ncbi:MAG: hypothetical protein V1867_06825 [Candidatus Falkowbacteria bacterium]
MAQYLSIGWFKAIGIVPALFIMGLFLCKLNVISWLGKTTIFISIGIGVIYGLLGVVGILKNMDIIEIKTTTVSLDDFLNLFRKNKK